MNKKKVCVVITSRGNYGKLKSVIRAFNEAVEFELQIVLGGSVVLDKYGKIFENDFTDKLVENATSYFLIEGETPVTMAKSAGLATIEFSGIFENLKPSLVIIIADRYECLAITMAATYMNIPIAHIEGGEVSGSIDELIRHSITKMSHIHFPASEEAAIRIEKMGENRNRIFNVGSTSFDILSELDLQDIRPIIEYKKAHGVGPQFDLKSSNYIVLSQHPVTTEYDENFNNMLETLHALEEFKIPIICVWPNMDAGSDGISKAIRIAREQNMLEFFYVFKSLPIELYGPLIFNSSCLVGNSSSGIREASFLGVPAVNIGSRQNGRQKGLNVIDALNEKRSIANSIRKQLANKRFEPDYTYGDGFSGQKIVNILSKTNVTMQKTITY